MKKKKKLKIYNIFLINFFFYNTFSFCKILSFVFRYCEGKIILQVEHLKNWLLGGEFSGENNSNSRVWLSFNLIFLLRISAEKTYKLRV